MVIVVRIGDLSFDSVDYDARSDVLYLSIGPPRPEAEMVPTPEGHAVRYGRDGRVTGVDQPSSEDRSRVWRANHDRGRQASR